jgi:glycosyltransferase involved in cell wall biosynthesis
VIRFLNILLINHYAGSRYHGMGHRPYYLANEWQKLGHKVTIVASSFSHLRIACPNLKGKFSHENIDGLQYMWVKTGTYQGNGWRRILNMFHFSFRLISLRRQILQLSAPDLVIASSPHPFIIFGAKILAKRSKAKLIFEVRDLWPLTMKELGKKSRFHPVILVMQWVENYCYQTADHVVSLLPKAYEYMRQHGLAPGKFTYIPNGVDIDEYTGGGKPIPDEHQKVFSELKGKGHFVVGYAGQHGMANALNYYIDAAQLLQSYPVTFVLVGQGPEKRRLQEKSRERRLTNIIFLPPVQKESIPNLLNQMDALFIGWRKEPIYRFGISPNKLMDYMMAAKPIIHAIEAGNDPVSECGCGISVSPENPAAIADAVVKLMRLSVEEREKIGLKGKLFVSKNHDYSVLAKKFIACIGNNEEDL